MTELLATLILDIFPKRSVERETQNCSFAVFILLESDFAKVIGGVVRSLSCNLKAH